MLGRRGTLEGILRKCLLVCNEKNWLGCYDYDVNMDVYGNWQICGIGDSLDPMNSFS